MLCRRYPNQVMKIIFTSLIILVCLICSFHISEKEKKNWYVFMYTIHVLFVQQILMGDDEKWIHYNNIRYHGVNKTNY